MLIFWPAVYIDMRQVNIQMVGLSKIYTLFGTTLVRSFALKKAYKDPLLLNQTIFETFFLKEGRYETSNIKLYHKRYRCLLK